MEIRPTTISLNNIVPFILGCYPFGSKISEIEANNIISYFINKGFNSLDIAPNYGGNRIYELIKNETGKYRKKLFLFVKIGVKKDKTIDNSYLNLSFQVEDALLRLNTSYLDSIILHWPDNNLSIEKQISNLQRLKKNYPINYIGLSNWELTESSFNKENIDILHLPYLATLKQQDTNINKFKKVFIYSAYNKGLLYKQYAYQQILTHTKNLTAIFDGIIFGISKLNQLKQNIEIYDSLK